MGIVIRVCLAFLFVVLIAVATVGCGPQEKQPVPETPTAQPGTPPETPPSPAEPASTQETPAGEETGTNVEIDVDGFLPEETPAGSASGRR